MSMGLCLFPIEIFDLIIEFSIFSSKVNASSKALAGKTFKAILELNKYTHEK
jgi:hypothetical protein